MRLLHTMIRVRDLEKSLAFYTDFVGLMEAGRIHIPEATLVFLTDENGHYYLELTYNQDGRDYEKGTQFGHLAFGAKNLDSIIAKVEEEGWKYRVSDEKRMESRYIFIQDPDGYDIEILEEKE